MLVVKMESHFYKKATGKINFFVMMRKNFIFYLKAINSGNGVVVKLNQRL